MEDPAERARELHRWAKDRHMRVAKTHDSMLVPLVIGKNSNDNTVVYKGAFKEGSKELADPAVNVFWIKYTKCEKGTVEEGLIWIEKQTAYGMSVKAGPDGTAELTVVALPKKPLRITVEKREGEEEPRIVARGEIGGVPNCVCLGVFVTVKDGWMPGVKFIDIIGEHPDSGQPMYERVSG
eukprot:Hpha_TRINITY_DN13519_c1_g2::TRINITY_DN13519_c1_g2_i1::g.111388::m.111388